MNCPRCNEKMPRQPNGYKSEARRTSMIEYPVYKCDNCGTEVAGESVETVPATKKRDRL